MFILLKTVYEKLPFMYYNVLALDCHRRSYCLDSYIAELLSSPTRAVGPLGTLTVMGNSVGCGSGLEVSGACCTPIRTLAFDQRKPVEAVGASSYVA